MLSEKTEHPLPGLLRRLHVCSISAFLLMEKTVACAFVYLHFIDLAEFLHFAGSRLNRRIHPGIVFAVETEDRGLDAACCSAASMPPPG